MMISQPSNLSKALYPHQLHAIAQLEHREVHLEMASTRNSTLYSNVGIYADITGYGKTITMVALILRDKRKFDSSEPYVRETVTQIYGHGNIVKKQISYYQRLNTTLILANQSILKQWIEEFTYTSLEIAVITNRRRCEQVDPFAYDVILCTPTMYNHFLSRFPNYAWKRFVFDEPSFTKVPAMRNIVAGFHWLVTATPDVLLYNHTKSPYTYLGALFAGYVEYNVFKKLIFKNDDEFVRSSVQLPPINHVHYQCPETITRLLKDLIPEDIAEMIAAGNIEGAIRTLGGTSSSNLFELIQSEKNELIKEAEMKIRRHARAKDVHKVSKWTERRDALRRQLDQLQSRLSNISNDESCHICLEQHVREPVITKCCYHAFCGSCILTWLKGHSTCPLCRVEMPPSGLIYLQSPSTTSVSLSSTKSTTKKRKSTPVPRFTKYETIRRLYQDRPDGRFIIFSCYDETFDHVIDLFDEDKVFQLKGKKMETRHRILDEYKSTDTKGAVLFLNSIEHGAGINLQEATDIILYHEMSESMETQVIGRCYRMGRTEPLVVHHLHS